MNQIKNDVRFMAGMGIVLLSMSAAAFAPRYLVPIGLGIYEAPSVWMHPHAISSLLWNLIFIAQPWLIASGNVRLHRRVGLAALVVAVANVVSGIGVQVDLLPAEPDNFSLTVGSAFRLFQSVPTFVIFLAAALALRRRTDYHLRFMYQTAFAAVGTVVGRLYSFYLAVPDEVVGPLIGVTSLAFVLVLPVYDKVRYARVHPASWIGLAAFVVFQVFVVGYVLNSGWWAAIATIQP